MEIKSFIWRIHGEWTKASVKNYFVVRLKVKTVFWELSPTKELTRLNENFYRLKNDDATWMPVIHFSKNNNEVEHEYQQGTHTAYCANSFADESTLMCLMIRQTDLELFREFIGNESFEVFTIEQYQNELPHHERKTYPG